ncbi:cAMP-dependent protein kinase catalytic subunit gamma-like [Galendromus occidentalis]|uniref:cAMP-dependent protein kinase catalytic subunit gamma-like n=1 Tax=Galendromus occidentalis TaxID=34638 RepID=A0AAJ6QX41_9ACAR|nr:cAMP-dependent protein kinase catalytic subunit gamma-like [Galendromus occidentalis]
MGQKWSKLLNIFRDLLFGPIPKLIDHEEGVWTDVEESFNARYERNLKSQKRQQKERFAGRACPKEEIGNFVILGHLASGAFGEVFKVYKRDNHTNYALKVQPKRLFPTAQRAQEAIYEKELQYSLDSEFVVKLIYAFQDIENLYQIIEYALYGDLMKIFAECNSEWTTKFYAAQIILGVEYLHACNVIHRDLKPANLFIFEDMYLKIGDFGGAKQVKGRTYTWVGTLRYMAPEMLDSAGHGKEVDWWAVGLLLYGGLYGELPFYRKGFRRSQIMDAIRHVSLTFPESVEKHRPVNRLISGLLNKKPHKRLGSLRRGVQEIKRNAWFSDISFSDVYSKKIRFVANIDPVRPKVTGRYEFLYRRTDDNPDPDRFAGF